MAAGGPLEMIFAETAVRQEGYVMPRPHCHGYFELFYVEAGVGVAVLDRNSRLSADQNIRMVPVEGESPEECLLREAKEETGLTLKAWRFRGIVTFLAEGFPTEYMCLYTADAFEGELKDCDEGRLEWVPKTELMRLNLWEGDKLFLRLLAEEAPFFSMKLCYRGDDLVYASLDGRALAL